MSSTSEDFKDKSDSNNPRKHKTANSKATYNSTTSDTLPDQGEGKESNTTIKTKRRYHESARELTVCA